MNLVYVNFTVIILIVVLLSRPYDTKDIKILGTGLHPIERRDVGFILYITVANTGHAQLHVVAKMVECCETTIDDDTDCSFMHVMGGNMGFLNPNTTRNITLIFPNMYPYNRKGDCLMAVWYRDRFNFTYEERTNIAFNTYNEHALQEEAGAELNKLGIGSKSLHLKKLCEGIDLDPYDNCKPADCHQKYNGERTYFSRLRNKCVPAPACYADPNKHLPDVAYLPVSNTCRDLENAVTEEDVRYLTKTSSKESDIPHKPKEESHDIPWSDLNFNVRCHHGVMSNITGLCSCDDGWTSPPVKDTQVISSTLLLHQCTIKKSTYINFFNFASFVNKFFPFGSKVILVGLGMNVIALILMCLCFPSIDEGYYRSLQHDADDSETEGSECMGTTEATDTESIDTCFLLLDKPGYSLYTQDFTSEIYGEIVEDIVNEFSKPDNINFDTPILGLSLSKFSHRMSDYSSPSFQIESGSDEDIDSELLPSIESDWEIHEMGLFDINPKEERTLLEEYLSQDKIVKRELRASPSEITTQAKNKSNAFGLTPAGKRGLMDQSKQKTTRSLLNKQFQSLLNRD